MPWPIYPWDRGPAYTVEEDRWASGPIWMGGRKENVSTGVRTPDHPVQSKPLF